MPTLRQGTIPCEKNTIKRLQNNTQTIGLQPKLYKQQMLGVGKRTSERKKGEDDAEFSSSSRVNNLKPANTDNKSLQGESKTYQFQKQKQKRNIKGETWGGTSPTPTEAHAMLSSAHKTIRSETEELPLGTESRRQDQP